ncbi:MAG: DAK2 domain-containing protein [Dehalococcoidia bacterium]|nr:DAK2 domain-containing protein [Dehalococcoidia bacterium]
MVTPASGNGQTAAGPGARPLSGGELLDALAAASAYLRESARAVDAINVYPVPDGDTGSNMAATLREAVDTALTVPEPRTVHEVLAALAKGALYGARGNSGVILSQALRGLAAGVPGDDLDAAALAAGLREASVAAYRAVANPVEGTMLTVLRAAADGAATGAAPGTTCLSALLPALAAAEAAEAGTIDQLPALKEAGVPDAGGEGVCVILRGLVAALTGTTPPAPAMPDRPIAQLAGHEHEQFGFCTEFVLEPRAASLDVDAVRAWAAGGTNRSVVVVGDEQAVRVHLHADDGEAVLRGAEELGRVSRAKLEDMSVQHLRFRASGSGAGARLGVLALSRGEGFDRLFESLGAAVGDLGDVVKPPAGEIAQAAEELGKADVIVLPNHSNVVLAARQAVDLARCTVHLVETRTLPQGLAAALAFDPEANVEENLARMREAAAGVVTVEVTTAAADRTADGIAVRTGQAIALVDGTLVAAEETPLAALLAGLAVAGFGDGALVTVFTGEGHAGDSEQVAAAIANLFPGVEVDMQDGGQPIYVYVASVEQ